MGDLSSLLTNPFSVIFFEVSVGGIFVFCMHMNHLIPISIDQVFCCVNFLLIVTDLSYQQAPLFYVCVKYLSHRICHFCLRHTKLLFVFCVFLSCEDASLYLKLQKCYWFGASTGAWFPDHVTSFEKNLNPSRICRLWTALQMRRRQ